MSKAKHTPGPWQHDSQDDTIVGHDKSLSIATIDRIDEGGEKGFNFGPISYANALLIAAAPELLDALKEIIDAADGGGWKAIDPSFGKARAAIAKATGGAA